VDPGSGGNFIRVQMLGRNFVEIKKQKKRKRPTAAPVHFIAETELSRQNVLENKKINR